MPGAPVAPVARTERRGRRAVGFAVRDVGTPLAELSDEALLAGLVAGDGAITVAFVRRFQAMVFGVALAVVSERASAEDIAQQAFERAWRHGASFDPRRGSVAAWLTALTRNAAIDATRVRRPTTAGGEELWRELRGPGPDPLDCAVSSEAAGDLRRALRALPEEQARAVVLAAIGGLSARQIAEHEAIPLGTAKTRIRTAMRRLRTMLNDGGDDV